MKLVAAVLAIAALACGCDRAPNGQAPPAAPQASAPAPAATAAAGPIVPAVTLRRPTDADRTQGATLAAQGGNGVAACVGCHGAQGEGNAAAGFPRLAGQSFSYLLHEMESYANGSRKHPVMQPIAAAMDAEQRVDTAAHYASLDPSPGDTSAVPQQQQQTNARGRQLAEVGDESKGVQACANCHGPGGIGSGQLYPYLPGQHASYLVGALAAWRDGSRANDPSGQMVVIAKSLNDADVQAVASWYAAQPLRAAPIDAEAQRPPPPATASVSAVVSGPRPDVTGPAAGAPPGGTEQGAPQSGGSQGPGFGGATSTQSTGQPGQ